MFEIVNKQILGDDVKKIDISASSIARKIKPGQYVSICPEEGDARIPLTVVDSDPDRGIISLIIREEGEATGKLGALPINETVFSILGPLGVPAKIEKRGVVLCVATGAGVAQMLPIAKAHKKIGNKVISIIGAKNKKQLILESQLRVVSTMISIATEDGSYERRGLATDLFKKLLDEQHVDLVYAIGAVEMMQAVCNYTRLKKMKTFVQLNPVMVDCLGMCGSCRVLVGNKILKACTDGPEFDGHLIDFEEYKKRINAFKESEQWQHQVVPVNLPPKESSTLTKFLSGFLRK